jgi:hypothetical protein
MPHRINICRLSSPFVNIIRLAPHQLRDLTLTLLISTSGPPQMLKDRSRSTSTLRCVNGNCGRCRPMRLSLQSVTLCPCNIRSSRAKSHQGVKAATSSTSKIEESRKRAEFHAETYRTARAAMTNLLPILQTHITDNILKLSPPLSATGIRPLPSAELQVGEGRKRVELSWIWKSYGSDQECVNNGKHGNVSSWF